jgi:hypothetical protein
LHLRGREPCSPAPGLFLWQIRERTRRYFERLYLFKQFQYAVDSVFRSDVPFKLSVLPRKGRKWHLSSRCSFCEQKNYPKAVNQGQQFVIAGYTSRRRNFDALVIGYYDGRKLIYATLPLNGKAALIAFSFNV